MRFRSFYSHGDKIGSLTPGRAMFSFLKIRNKPIKTAPIKPNSSSRCPTKLSDSPSPSRAVDVIEPEKLTLNERLMDMLTWHALFFPPLIGWQVIAEVPFVGPAGTGCVGEPKYAVALQDKIRPTIMRAGEMKCKRSSFFIRHFKKELPFYLSFIVQDLDSIASPILPFEKLGSMTALLHSH